MTTDNSREVDMRGYWEAAEEIRRRTLCMEDAFCIIRPGDYPNVLVTIPLGDTQ